MILYFFYNISHDKDEKLRLLARCVIAAIDRFENEAEISEKIVSAETEENDSNLQVTLQAWMEAEEIVFNNRADSSVPADEMIQFREYYKRYTEWVIREYGPEAKIHENNFRTYLEDNDLIADKNKVRFVGSDHKSLKEKFPWEQIFKDYFIPLDAHEPHHHGLHRMDVYKCIEQMIEYFNTQGRQDDVFDTGFLSIQRIRNLSLVRNESS